MAGVSLYIWCEDHSSVFTVQRITFSSHCAMCIITQVRLRTYVRLRSYGTYVPVRIKVTVKLELVVIINFTEYE